MEYFIFTILFWVILILAVAAGVTWFVLWIGYRIIVAAVRRGILEADAERTRIAAGHAPTAWNLLKAQAE